MATQSKASSYSALPTHKITASNGIEYAYREVGTSPVPLVLLQHFRGNLDNWDPALLDDLSAKRRVITFNNTGVGSSSGSTPSTIYEMSRDALAFTEALGLERVDLLGFSIGSFIAQEIALARPAFVRKMVLASSAPKGAPGMHGWAP
jgi:pimeloyl-ACP methyl ester carboxylesterase